MLPPSQITAGSSVWCSTRVLFHAANTKTHAESVVSFTSHFEMKTNTPTERFLSVYVVHCSLYASQLRTRTTFPRSCSPTRALPPDSRCTACCTDRMRRRPPRREPSRAGNTRPCSSCTGGPECSSSPTPTRASGETQWMLRQRWMRHAFRLRQGSGRCVVDSDAERVASGVNLVCVKPW